MSVSTFEPGDSTTVSATPDDEITVVWSGPDGADTQIMADYVVPEGTQNT